MGWRIWERGLKRLPRPVKKYLLEKFKVSPTRIKELRCLKRRGRFAGRKVIYLQIVDLSSPKKPIFRGYTESEGFILLERIEN